MTKENGCRDLCRYEKLKRCVGKRYLNGYKSCMRCEICYDPKDKLNIQPDQSMCYCCLKRLRHSPKDKSLFQKHLVRIV